MQMPVTVPRSRKLLYSAPSSSPERCASVATRQWSFNPSASYVPNTVCVLPTSMARSISSIISKHSPSRRAFARCDRERASAATAFESSSHRRSRCRTQKLQVVVGAKALADLFGERLRGQTLLLALGPQLLDGDVARRPGLGARNDAGRTVLVPDPDVLHLQVEERVRRLRHLGQLEPVAQVGGVLGEDAVAEHTEDG